MQDDDYEWDDAKAARNLRDHGVSFDEARLVFDDPFAFFVDDDSEHYGEDRFNVIGFVGQFLLHVNYTFRGDRTRIISARGAEPHERRRYQDAASR